MTARVSSAIALVALIALAAAAVTMTSRLTSAGGPDPAPAVQACDQQDEADDAAEADTKEADTDSVEEQCGPQDDAAEAEDGDAQVQSGTLDDGKDLLPQAGISLDQAIAAAQSAASGPVGEVDLEYLDGKLVFNVDVGDKDVKVDPSNGTILSVDSDD